VAVRTVEQAPILVVEDNPATRAALASLLNFVGYTSVTVRSAEEALSYLEDGGRPCAMVLDLALPGMQGDALREKLLAHKRFATIPVVVYSARDGVSLPNVIAHVRKSADPEVLLAAVARACGKADDIGTPSGSA
jgi:CheY-like chemotaxis protein